MWPSEYVARVHDVILGGSVQRVVDAEMIAAHVGVEEVVDDDGCVAQRGGVESYISCRVSGE